MHPVQLRLFGMSWNNSCHDYASILCQCCICQGPPRLGWILPLPEGRFIMSSGLTQRFLYWNIYIYTGKESTGVFLKTWNTMSHFSAYSLVNKHATKVGVHCCNLGRLIGHIWQDCTAWQCVDNALSTLMLCSFLPIFTCWRFFSP